MNSDLRIRDLPALALVLIFVFVSMAPLVWLGLAAFKPTVDIIAIPPVWIPNFTYLKNFQDVLVQFWPFILNSVVATMGGTALSLILAVPTAFALATFRFRGRDALAGSGFLDAHDAADRRGGSPLRDVPRRGPHRYPPWSRHRLRGLQSLLRRLDVDVLRAPRPEGTGRGSAPPRRVHLDAAFWRIVLPLSRSGLAAVATFVFIFAWDEFLLALSYDSRSQDIPGCDFLLREHGKGLLGLYRRASVIQCLPPVLFSFFMQKHIVSGITMGAVKD